ncbi:MAG: AtpZ/AtpI family protein [Thiohalomonadales bacterium]
MNSRPDKRPKGPGLLLIGVGTILSSMAVAGFLLGYLTDRWLATSPWFFLAFGLLGFVGGLLKVYRMLTDPDLY